MNLPTRTGVLPVPKNASAGITLISLRIRSTFNDVPIEIRSRVIRGTANNGEGVDGFKGKKIVNDGGFLRH